MDGHEDARYKIVFNSAVELGAQVSEFLGSITDSTGGKIMLGAGAILIFWWFFKGERKNY